MYVGSRCCSDDDHNGMEEGEVLTAMYIHTNLPNYPPTNIP